MASNTYNMNTWGAKRIFGDTSVASITEALLQITANNSWILSSGRQSTYGIKYVYDSSTDHDKIELYGGYQVSSADIPTAWVQLDTGDVYILGKVGINHAPDTYQLYVDGTSYFTNTLTLDNGSINGELIQIIGVDGKSFSFKLTSPANQTAATNVDIGWDWAAGDGAGAAFRGSSFPNQPGYFVIYARKDTTAEYALVGRTDGYLTWRGNIIPNTGNNTGTVGSTTLPVWVDSGQIKTITSYEGNAASATKWQTARTLTIGATGKSVDGSANVSWSMNEIMGSSDSTKFYRGDKTWSSRLTGGLDAAYIGVTNTNSTTGYGVSLYNGATAGAPTYGIMFAGTGTFGTHINVSSDWATYFTMSNTTTRGWIFRRGSTNVASIDGRGRLTLGYANSSDQAGIYWNPYVESASDGSDVSRIIQVKSGAAGGTELQIYQANDAADIINLVTPKSIYLNSKEAFNVSDAWLRINENAKFTSGVYFGSSTVRTDGEFWSDKVRIVDDWVGFYNTVQGGTRYGFLEVTSTKYYFRKENGADSWPFDFNGNIYTSGIIRTDNEIRGDQIRLYDNWVGFYQSANAGGSRYGYIKCNVDRMYFRKENGVSTYHFDFNGHIYASSTIHAGAHIKALGGYLYSTANSNTVTIGSQNSSWCHFENSANIPFYFGRNVHVNSQLVIYNTGTKLYNNYLEFAQGGGWYMSDATYVRVRGNKRVYNGNTERFAFYTEGGFASGGSAAEVISIYYGGAWRDIMHNHKNGNLSLDACGGSLYLSYWAGNTYFGGGTYYIDRSGNWNGAAYLLYYRHGNEINFKGGRQHCYFNYRNGDDDSTGTAMQPNYYFCNYATAANGIIRAGQVWSAVWNDFAEFRESEITEPGRVLVSNGMGQMILAQQRLIAGAKVITDTFGCSVGESDTAKTPLGVAGRVLVYTYQSRDNYKVGDSVCSAPNGTVDIMTREEIKEYPDRIIGIVDEIPTYETWEQYQTLEKEGEKPVTSKLTDVPVKGRIWIYVR